MPEHVEYHTSGKKRTKDMLPRGMATGIQEILQNTATNTYFESAY
jgi:hypothetical protein